MPVVEKRSPGRVVVRGIGEFTQGDQADVSTADAQYLCEERGDFTRVDESDPESEWAVDSGDESETDDVDEDPLEGVPVAEIDASEHLDRWLDQHYTHRAKQVRAGDVDDSLGEIEAAETSETVIEAVQDRRDDLAN